MVEAAPLERVVQLARAVRGDHDGGRLRGGDRPELGHGDGEVGEHLEQERLELVVGAVELVDQQHRAARRPRIARSSGRSSRNSGAVELADPLARVELARLERPRVEQLPRVVPLVERLRRVDPLVALQPDQLGAEHARERLPDLGLADARLALEQQRPAHREREEDRRREPAVREVVGAGERPLDLFTEAKAIAVIVRKRRWNFCNRVVRVAQGSQRCISRTHLSCRLAPSRRGTC